MAVSGLRGFSLIELIMVLAIMATISAIAVPRYLSSLDRYRTDFAARRIAADLELASARAKALSLDQTVVFTADPTDSVYRILGMADPDHPSAIYTVELGESPYHVRIHSTDLGGDGAVTYNGHGLPDSGGSITVAAGAHQATVAFLSPLDSAVIE